MVSVIFFGLPTIKHVTLSTYHLPRTQTSKHQNCKYIIKVTKVKVTEILHCPFTCIYGYRSPASITIMNIKVTSWFSQELDWAYQNIISQAMPSIYYNMAAVLERTHETLCRKFHHKHAHTYCVHLWVSPPQWVFESCSSWHLRWMEKMVRFFPRLPAGHWFNSNKAAKKRDFTFSGTRVVRTRERHISARI